MEIPFVNLKEEYHQIKPEIDKAVLDVIESGSFIMGKYVSEFEKNIGAYLGQNALGCASGTDALLMALLSLKIGPGDEVITTPFSFFATAGAIARIGAIPKFIDIDPHSFNLNISLIESAITKKTKAILPVHIFGNPIDMTRIVEIAKQNKLATIEDACQAIGCDVKGKKAGTIGDIGCFSFFPTKNLGGFGDGGLITCHDPELFKYLSKLRVHGSDKKYIHDFIGINSRLDAIQAVVLNIKLKYLEKRNEKRRAIAKKYNAAFKGLMETPQDCSFGKHIYHQYALLSNRRDDLLKYLNEKHIAAGIYYPLPLHLQDAFKYLKGKIGDCPIAEDISNKVFSLPIYPEMTDAEINFVIETVCKFFN